jgi:uncharacterized protein (TIGR03435 family)
MTGLDDHELLAEYARSESEAAFATLVERHVNLVYSAGLRFTGNPHHAEEITQAVFVILARKAGGLRRGTVLSGWLYQTARLTAANFVKGEIRRQRREQEVYMQSALTEPEPAAWEQIAPLLDEAMGHLGETDRNAVVLRYFENKTARQVAAALKLTEAAAHKRVNRALEKLHRYFSKRGVSSTTVIIAGAISDNSIQAAPVGMAKTISAVAIAKGAVASTSTLTLIQGALKIMAWTKLKTVIVVGAATLLTVSTTTVVVKKVFYKNLWADDPKYWETDSSALGQVPAGVFIFRPTRFPKTGGLVWVGDRVSAKNCFVSEVVNVAYGFSHARTILPPAMPRGNFDVMSTMPGGSATPLKDELQKRFHLTARTETRPADVLILKVQNPNPPDLKPHNGDDGNSSWVGGNRKTTIRNRQISGFLYDIESRIGRPVIDETGLTGKYDLQIQWQPRAGESDKDAYVRTMREQFGLVLVPSREPIEMLVVEKVK